MISPSKILGVLTILVLFEVCSVFGANRTAEISSDESREAKKDKGNSTKGRSFDRGDGDRRGSSRSNKHNQYHKSRKYFHDHCKDKLYTIREAHDLTKHRSDLDCIFHRAYTPNKVPEGPLHGSIISVMKTDWFNAFIGFVWNGKIILKTSCNGKESYIGWNNLGSAPSFPFKARLGPLDETLENGEHEDELDSVVLDYTKDFAKTCPEYKDISKSRTQMHNMFNLNQVIMVLRIVGQKRDGSAIYLGKTYVKDGHHGDKKVKNIAYFAVTNFDPAINPPEGYQRDSRESSGEDRRGKGDGMGSLPALPALPAMPSMNN